MAARADPCLVIIFGASGDLATRKLIPSLFDLAMAQELPASTRVLGVARSEMTDDEWRRAMAAATREHASRFDAVAWDRFAGQLFYVAADATSPGDWQRIRARAAELASPPEINCNTLLYLSVKPSLYEPIIQRIDESGLVTEGRRWCSLARDRASWQRIVVEKPFGLDLESAQSLNRALGRVFDEDAIYRIDHFLGKELVQNLMVLRFANSIFEPVWNHRYVDHVQITAAETLGVGHRAGFYDETGAVRDMIQSHLLQVMALVAMEPPTSFAAAHLRSEKIKTIDAIESIAARELGRSAALGQYAHGGGEPAYHELPDVRSGTTTETFAAVRFQFDNWRWAGTPFYVRTGKRLACKCTNIVVQFKRPPADLFAPKNHAASTARDANRMVIEIAPKAGMTLRVEGKVPGEGLRIGSAELEFDYVERFGEEPAESYGPLLLDSMRGEQMLFPHRAEIEASWRAVMPLIGAESAELRKGIHANYQPGSWGPKAADELLKRDGRAWHNLAGS
jgi:glucose-6-phosphate 1-dehydrogenase